MKAAVIGIGSNSLRLLVANLDGGKRTTILRERIGLRIFSSLNLNHEIDEDMIFNACEAVWLMQETARKHGAVIIRLFATSAVRDAANQSAFQEALRNKTGLTLDILSGELEAKLSFFGAAGEACAGMIDIGGGSTEIAIGDHGEIGYACSLQAGAVRLFRVLPIMSASDIAPAFDFVCSLLTPHADHIRQMKTPGTWLGVGGTMTAAATCIQDIPWDSIDRIHGFSAKRDDLRRVTEGLASMTPEKRATVHSIPPDRADIIVHGFVILLACMETLEIKEIIISEHTNLDGYLRMVTGGE